MDHFIILLTLDLSFCVCLKEQVDPWPGTKEIVYMDGHIPWTLEFYDLGLGMSEPQIG